LPANINLQRNTAVT